jgi:hypothetical protein
MTLQQAQAYCDNVTATSFGQLNILISSLTATVAALQTQKANKTDAYAYVDASVANATAVAANYTNAAVDTIRTADLVWVYNNISAIGGALNTTNSSVSIISSIVSNITL